MRASAVGCDGRCSHFVVDAAVIRVEDYGRGARFAHYRVMPLPPNLLVRCNIDVWRSPHGADMEGFLGSSCCSGSYPLRDLR